MSNLKDLVPPLELCKLISAGEFAESAALWVFFPKSDKKFYLYIREDLDWSKAETYPAPTLQEIMAELPACDCYRFSDKNEWTVLLVNGPVDDGVKSDSPATAALKVWLKLKGIEV